MWRRLHSNQPSGLPVRATQCSIGHSCIMRSDDTFTASETGRAPSGPSASVVELLQPLGALPYLERVETDLASWGARVDEDRSRSTLELTEREQSVAALVGRGLTNRQVAAELYVSQKAVEYHLSNIYGKLGIRSRQELRNHPALAREAVGA